jgi:Mannosyl-glycoprotein endo-beta-N-acetylglucosaminidase
MMQLPKSWFIFFSRTVLLLTVMYLFGSYLPIKKVNKDKSHEISVELLAKALIRHDLHQWKIVLAQAVTESGWEFSSGLYRTTHNFIGMRIPGNRESARSGRMNGYSTYDSWEDCVQDIKLWQDSFWKGGSYMGYINLMNRIWAESPDYKSALINIKYQLDKAISDYMEHNRDDFNYKILMAYLEYQRIHDSPDISLR